MAATRVRIGRYLNSELLKHHGKNFRPDVAWAEIFMSPVNNVIRRPLRDFAKTIRVKTSRLKLFSRVFKIRKNLESHLEKSKILPNYEARRNVRWGFCFFHFSKPFLVKFAYLIESPTQLKIDRKTEVNLDCTFSYSLASENLSYCFVQTFENFSFNSNSIEFECCFLFCSCFLPRNTKNKITLQT